MSDDSAFDVLVVGSGAAGLVAALSAAVNGATVAVLERSPLLGGTSAISGGQIWSPLNGLMSDAGAPDNADEALNYLDRVTMGMIGRGRLAVYIQRSPALLTFLRQQTDLRFFRLDRPDYHPDFPGARDGRAFEPFPYDISPLGALADIIRTSPVRAPITSQEARSGAGAALQTERNSMGIRAQGAALVAGLVQGCLERAVTFQRDARVTELLWEGTRVCGCSFVGPAGKVTLRARAGIVLASGGFEWNRKLKEAFLSPADEAPTSPPWNDGDGLVMGLGLGAGIANMTQSWSTAAVRIPGEQWDGRPLFRNIVRELALPGSILVNSDGHRFVNEASPYNELGKAFQRFDPGRYLYPNRSAWLVFDQRFKRSYSVLIVNPSDPAPPWFKRGESVADLATRIGVDAAALTETVNRFNEMASSGKDFEYGRGSDRHGLTYGDPDHAPNPCLAPLLEPPFFAISIVQGNNGTKGGLTTDADGRVTRFDGSPIAGLFACGNVASSLMGPGYPGTGGSLGPAMTDALFVGHAIGTAAQTLNPL